jgi:hypothetical protein
MMKLEIFDPAMCCSTGVCGVDVDPVLAQFAADLKWVEGHGVTTPTILHTFRASVGIGRVLASG